MNTIICGSIAYDQIMHFQGRFADYILPDAITRLNVCFVSHAMRREFGGCATNIAYNLKLLGDSPLIVATMGEADSRPYIDRLQALDISTEYILEVNEAFTAQALITTDSDNNQVTTFYPGAMNEAHRNPLPTVTSALAIVAPDGKEAMMTHAKNFAARDIPFVFDPGQGLPMFSAQELIGLIDQASFLTLNDYEEELLKSVTGFSDQDLLARLNALIVTHGDKGSVIKTQEKHYSIAPVPVAKALDPTGCGDAYRAGLLYGMTRNWDWQSCGQLGSVMGALKIASLGPQNHRPNLHDIIALYQLTYGLTIDLS